MGFANCALWSTSKGLPFSFTRTPVNLRPLTRLIVIVSVPALTQVRVDGVPSADIGDAALPKAAPVPITTSANTSASDATIGSTAERECTRDITPRPYSG